MTDESEFYAKDSERFTHADAKIIGPQLAELERVGPLIARDVVEVARSENSPLHAYFEWDDSKAAGLYRIGVAREMIKTVRVRYLRSTQQRNPVVAVARIARQSGLQRSPVQFQAPITHNAAAKMREALSELQAWRREYERFCAMWPAFESMFAPIMRQIGKLELPPNTPHVPLNGHGEEN